MGAVFAPPRQRFEVTVEMLAQHIDELPPDTAEYAGPSLRDELWALGSNITIKFSAVAIVGAPPPQPEQSQPAPSPEAGASDA